MAAETPSMRFTLCSAQRILRCALHRLQRGGERPEPIFYRFQKPTDPSYPVKNELFSRAPEGLEHEENATLTPSQQTNRFRA